MTQRLIDFGLKNRLLVVVLAVLVVAGGWFSYRQLPVDAFPDVSPNLVQVFTVTEGLAPGVVNITQGWWIDQFSEGSVNHLTHDVINPVQEKVYEPNMHMNDVAVEIEKC